MDPGDDIATATGTNETEVVPITPDNTARYQLEDEEVSEEGSSITQSEATDTAEVLLEEALQTIGDYRFDPSLGESTRIAEELQENTEEEAIATALIMFSPTTATAELPTLRTEAWMYDGQEPTPISIETARRLLAAAYTEIPCELEAAGDHGYAWIIESEETWLERDGTKLINAPTKPKEIVAFDMKAQWEYAVKLRRYNMYKHLTQEGKIKLMTWFGKEMFVDLFKKGILPPAKTPNDLLAHISSTYATPSANRICMEAVEERVNKAYDPKKPVQAYFLQLQEARTDAELLGIAYSDQQIMNKALKQFEIHDAKESSKAEKKWNKRASKDKTWKDFKEYWKDEIHEWKVYAARGPKKSAHQAIDVNTLVDSVTELQAEARSLQANNTELVWQLNFHQAMQAEQRDHSTNRSYQDDMSAITDQLAGLKQDISSIQFSTSQNKSSGTGTGTSTTDSTRTQELLHIAQNRDPKEYRNLNGGKGKRFRSYCVRCGCNCTHWTRKCLELSAADRLKCKDADFDNRMGGSTKFLDRRGKYQTDYGFDSL